MRGSTELEPKKRRRRQRRATGKPFPKGTSGNPARQFGVPKTGNPPNPGGRPRSAKELADLAQAHGAQIIEELAAVALTGFGTGESLGFDEDELKAVGLRPPRRARAKWQDRIRAGDIVLERGYGRAPQPIVGPDGGPLAIDDVSKMTTGERVRRLAELIAKGSATAAEPPPPEKDQGDGEPGGS